MIDFDDDYEIWHRQQLRQSFFDFEMEIEILKTFKKWKAEKIVEKILKNGLEELKKNLAHLVARIELDEQSDKCFHQGMVVKNLDLTQKPYIIHLCEGNNLEEATVSLIHELIHIPLLQTEGFCGQTNSQHEEENYKEFKLMEEMIEWLANKVFEENPEGAIALLRENIRFYERSFLFLSEERAPFYSKPVS